MRYICLSVIIILVGSWIHSGCAKKPSPDDKILARVSNNVITLGELKSKIAKMPLYYRNIVEKNKKRYLDEVIVEMLFYEEAVRKGVDRDKEVKEVISEAKKKIVIAKFIKNEVEDKIKISNEEATAFYEANNDQFKGPQLWRASHILVSSEKEANSILDRLSKGESFEDLARAYSTDVTAGRGGDIGYFKMGQLVPDFEKACMKMEVGQTSGVVHTQFGYHIIRLTDKKEPDIKSLSEARDAIEAELKRKKRSELFNDLVSNLKDKHKVKIEEDVFNSLDAIDEEAKAQKNQE